MSDVVLPDAHIRRILVALDASAHSEAALQCAVEVAALLGAEVVGLFVEDVDLLRVAQLPFVREVRYPVAAVHDLDVAQMESHWRQQARQVRRGLEAVASAQDVSWTFRVERGGVAEKLAEAAESADLVALGRIGRAIARRALLGSTARRTARRLSRPVLLVREGIDLAVPVVLVYDGSSAADRAVAIAASFAKRSGQLHVLVWMERADDVESHEQRVAAQLADQRFEVTYQRFDPVEGERFVEMLKTGSAALLVLPQTEHQQSRLLLELALEQLTESLLVVR